MPSALHDVTAKDFYHEILQELERQSPQTCESLVKSFNTGQYEESRVYGWVTTAFYDLKKAGLTSTEGKGQWVITLKGTEMLQSLATVTSLVWTPTPEPNPKSSTVETPECFGYYIPVGSACQLCKVRTACFESVKIRLESV